MTLPLLAITAWSGTGKTTLLKQLIPLLIQKNIPVGLIKHTHHKMDIDTKGKDSYELRKAGAHQTIVASSKRWALMTEMPEETEPDLQDLASKMDPRTLKLILVEGFKREPIPKIQLFRKAAGHALEDFTIDPHTIAVASDVPLENLQVQQLNLNNPAEIADFIENWLAHQAS
ncbi:molybdopterin-guanine dinucleotide biosynthesis protein B [Acetobacteraceae bacterium]|nr:molybdopterin-guanine dinucleotide biosynthesis protein B [Acetobacteraceae bacterium]